MFGRTRIWVVAGAAALALVAAGCGGSSASSTGGGGSGGATSIVPASAPVYVSVNTDLSSSQWTTVDTLLSKFPGKQALLENLRKSVASGSSFTWADVKPALGDVLDVAFLDLGSQPTWAALLQPKDGAAFDALVAKANAKAKPADKVYVGESGGWKVVSNSAKNVDAFKQAAASGDKLADDATFKEATGGLADDALLTAYANGAKVSAALKNALGSLGGTVTGGTGQLRWIAADLVAVDAGLKLDGRARTATTAKQGGAPYKAQLLQDVPSGALLYLSFNGGGQLGQTIQKSLQGLPPAAKQYGQIFQQIAPILAHENALYVRAGSPLPEITLVAVPDDPAKGAAAVDRLIAKLAGGAVTPKPVQIAGASAKELNFGRFSLFYGTVGDKVVVTDLKTAFETVKAGGPSLADDPTFKEAKTGAGMPDATEGFVYVNIKDAVPLLESLVQLAGSSVPAQVSENARPLRTFIAYAAKDGADVTTFTAFLGVK